MADCDLPVDQVPVVLGIEDGSVDVVPSEPRTAYLDCQNDSFRNSARLATILHKTHARGYPGSPDGP
jgi:hypothetical protein